MPRYCFGDIEFDPARFRLARSGQAVHLEPKALRVLVFLLDNRGRLVDKGELQDAVWPDTAVTENALTRVIAQLRKAMGDDARESRFIETVPTRGYRFVGDVEVREDAPTATEVPSPAAPPSPGRWAAALLGGTLAIAVAVSAGWWLGSDRAARGTTRTPPLQRTLVSTTSGFNAFPTFSPDGDSVAYVSDRSGRLEIYLRPLAAGSREVAVTSDGEGNVQPAWSPDGRFIAYHSMARGGLWIVPALGGVARRLTEFGSRPMWSPDGSRLAFQSLALAGLEAVSQASSTLWIVPAEGGEPRPVTRVGQPTGGHGPHAWSPDGTHLAFVAGGLWTVGVDTGELREVARRDHALDVAYAPDGASLYWSAVAGLNFRVLHTVLASGETEELLNTGGDGPRHFSITRDGRRLAFALTRVSSDLMALPLDADGRTSGAASAVTPPSPGRKSLPVFSPDGRRLTYHRVVAGAPPELWLWDAGMGATSQAIASASIVGGVDWFPSGDRLGMASTRDGALQYVAVGMPGGQTETLLDLPPDTHVVRLMPDGGSVVFQGLEGGVLNLWRADLATHAVRRLTRDGEGVGWAVPSRDGRQLAVQLYRGHDTTQVAVMPSDGGALRPLTTHRGQNWVHSWSPDGKRVAFAALREGIWNVFTIGLGGDERRLTSFDAPRAFVRYPAWSPGGDRLVFEKTEIAADVWVMQLAR